LETLAITLPSRSTSYSWSTKFPFALNSPGALEVDREPVADADERLLHSRRASASVDCHLVPDVQLSLLDLGDLVPLGVLKNEGLADAQRLAVHAERAVPGLVLDPVVVAYREQLLAHAVARAAGELVLSASQDYLENLARFRLGRIVRSG
jgi:hypothetical protein